jgi:urease accessory protein UreH
MCDMQQMVHMSGSSALLWLDWYSAGRVANGEFWDFNRLANQKVEFELSIDYE